MTPPNSNRIDTIDGFRCLAVMMVIIFHYYGNIPSAGLVVEDTDVSPYYRLLMYGFYGVQLFFVVSGFVIAHTLLKCETFSEFIIRRLIRLMPALVVCCLITFLVVKYYHLAPIQESPLLLDLLPSLTFTPPDLWQALLNRADINYIDPAYWTLSVEMMFYIVAGALFFYNQKNFRSNWLLLITILLFIRIVTSPKMHGIIPSVLQPYTDNIYSLYLLLNLSMWVYFAVGIFFYSVFSEGIASISVIDKILMTFLIITEYYFLEDLTLRILFTLINVLFLIFIYRNSWLGFLRSRFFLWIGLISYPIYLLHQNIGIMMMYRISGALQIPALDIHLPVIVTALMFGVSYVIFRFIETPVSHFLRARLLKQR